MNRFRQSLLILTSLYLLYLLKWAVGIDFLPGHHAPRIVKLPAKAVIYGVKRLGVGAFIPHYNSYPGNQEIRLLT